MSRTQVLGDWNFLVDWWGGQFEGCLRTHTYNGPHLSIVVSFRRQIGTAKAPFSDSRARAKRCKTRQLRPVVLCFVLSHRFCKLKPPLTSPHYRHNLGTSQIFRDTFIDAGYAGSREREREREGVATS